MRGWRRHRSLLVVVSTWLLLAHPLSVVHADTTVTRYSVKGNTAIAQFQTTSPTDGCIEYFVSVVASDLMQKVSPGPKSSQVGTVLAVEIRDVCQNLVLFLGEGETSQQSLRIAKNLSGATLTTTVTVFDVISTLPYTFAVNLTWTAQGPVEANHDHEIFRDQSLLINSQVRGSRVEAVAIGTVVGLGVNLTPAPSISAELQTQNDGTVVIQISN
jgi:hypothetical protein